MKIALHYFFTSSKQADEVFIIILLYLQESLNNSCNSSTDYASNKLAYDFQTKNILDSLTDIVLKDYSRLWQIYCEEVKQTIAFANATLKHYYDTKHTSLFIEDIIYLCLFHSYIIPDLTNWKLSNQCVDFFHIIKL